jgi:hypothetical protein
LWGFWRGQGGWGAGFGGFLIPKCQASKPNLSVHSFSKYSLSTYCVLERRWGWSCPHHLAPSADWGSYQKSEVNSQKATRILTVSSEPWSSYTWTQY